MPETAPLFAYVADHAGGGRRSVVNPGTELWRPRSGFGAVFGIVKSNKNKFISMKPNSNLNDFQLLLFHYSPAS